MILNANADCGQQGGRTRVEVWEARLWPSRIRAADAPGCACLAEMYLIALRRTCVVSLLVSCQELTDAYGPRALPASLLNTLQALLSTCSVSLLAPPQELRDAYGPEGAEAMAAILRMPPKESFVAIRATKADLEVCVFDTRARWARVPD
jgi:hypothetical protein